MPEDSAKHSTRRTVYLALLFFISTILSLVALISPLLSSYRTPAPAIGQVAGKDFRAPQAVTFDSVVLTEQRRDVAERAILPIYTAPDTRIARQQLERLRAALAYISSVRADLSASSIQKLADLALLEDVRLSQETASTIVSLTEARWQELQQETIEVLEKVMSGGIRQEDVQKARDSIPAVVSLSLPEAQASAVAEMAAAFVIPNSQFSEEMTLEARQAARDAIAPVIRSFVPGQTIVQSGDVLDAADLEALQYLGLARPEQNWQDLASAAALALLMMIFLMLYLRRKQAIISRDMRSIAIITILFLAFLVGARLAIPGGAFIAYMFPLAAYGLTVAALFTSELALVTSLPLAILVAYGLPNALELTVYFAVECLFGVLAVGRARRLITFFWAGAAIAVSGSATILIYHLPRPGIDSVGMATLVAAALLNGLASASITLLLQFLLAQFLGMTTPIQLMDLTRPDHPLLRLLLRDTPGTYQHSLQVANLAEQAGERIGADALLIRVGALYHDVGKTMNPILFIENQPPGIENPHSALTPEESAALIIQHVLDGLELGRRHRLPGKILEFITEHHGTSIARYQYVNAVKAAGGDESKVDIEKFRYPGPRPQSRETAILMLADGSEARVRAERPTDENALRSLVKEVINYRLSNGQLDDTKLTMRDLNSIIDSFTITLRSAYHPRMQYPKLEASSFDEITTPISQQAAELGKRAEVS